MIDHDWEAAESGTESCRDKRKESWRESGLAPYSLEGSTKNKYPCCCCEGESKTSIIYRRKRGVEREDESGESQGRDTRCSSPIFGYDIGEYSHDRCPHHGDIPSYETGVEEYTDSYDTYPPVFSSMDILQKEHEKEYEKCNIRSTDDEDMRHTTFYKGCFRLTREIGIYSYSNPEEYTRDISRESSLEGIDPV